jgi:hypothetical protein
MKKIDVGQTIGILANLGVIAGIAFLAIEIGQNNELMQAAARSAQDERIQDYIEQVYMVPGLADIIMKANSGVQLTETEELIVYNRQLRLLRGFEAQYREYLAGRVDSLPRDIEEHFYKGRFRNPPLIATWEKVRTDMRPEFVEYIDEQLANR